SITGSILGAILITVLPEVLREFSEWRLVIYSALLILIMLTRPQGMLGQREFGLNWLRRPQKGRVSDEAVGASKGLPIADEVESDSAEVARRGKE
ncbi:MAG TPA: hypothetical protein VKC34_13780, partial [Blastocatellia bacterium]|nr:hypothetical protein [Blastocatellia bacterium]